MKAVAAFASSPPQAFLMETSAALRDFSREAAAARRAERADSAAEAASVLALASAALAAWGARGRGDAWGWGGRGLERGRASQARALCGRRNHNSRRSADREKEVARGHLPWRRAPRGWGPLGGLPCGASRGGPHPASPGCAFWFLVLFANDACDWHSRARPISRRKKGVGEESHRDGEGEREEEKKKGKEGMRTL